MELRDQRVGNNSNVILVIVCLILQAGLSPQVAICGGTFDFMFVLVFVMALRADVVPVVATGFLSGLFYDLTGSTPVGLMALVLTVCSFALAHSTGIRSTASTSNRVAGIFGYCLVAHVIFGILLFAMGVQTSVLFAIFGHGLATSVLTTLATLLFIALFPVSARSMGFSPKAGGTRFKTKTKSLK